MDDALQFSLRFAVVGIAIVFSALIIITAAISLIRRANDSWQKKEDDDREKALTKEQSIDNTTLVLIAAAAATMIQGRFYIRSVRRLLPAKAAGGPWSVQGRAILLGSHVVTKKR